MRCHRSPQAVLYIVTRHCSTSQLMLEVVMDTMALCRSLLSELHDRLESRCDIVQGRVSCCGSPMFLKHNYGVGYQMTLVKAAVSVCVYYVCHHGCQ